MNNKPKLKTSTEAEEVFNKGDKKERIREIDDENKFYHELDLKKAHTSCCSCQTLSLLVTTIFIIFVIGVSWIYYQVTRTQNFSFKFNTNSINLNASIKGFQDKISGIRNSENQTVLLVLNEEEFTAILSSGINFDSLIMKDILVTIEPTGIKIYGTLSKLFSSQVAVTMIPVVENGKIKFVTESFQAGNINSPKWLTAKLSNNFSEIISNKFSSIYSVMKVEKASLESGEMVIEGTGVLSK